ncbi:MAG: ribose-5-phosphate isomerase RpiA, partial [Thermoplasmata archaeon]
EGLNMENNTDTHYTMKSEASMKALEYALEKSLLQDGMIVGLGTGSTAEILLKLLAGKVKDGLLIKGVPTSVRTRETAQQLGIPLIGLDEAVYEKGWIDITFDGADEIDPKLCLIKGKGGALLREKVIASLSKYMFVVADETKEVKSLGKGTALPVEVDSFCLPAVFKSIEKMGGKPAIRKKLNMEKSGTAEEDYLTDGGNKILDVVFESIPNPYLLDKELKSLVGVIETGLFVNLCSDAFIGTESGVIHRQRKHMFIS